ncbi:polysaccharide pyruvyl transferase family protein [Ancylobacter sp. IITR112]|uniref:polysaccharide pyruvyl transferase family protein n=1 Tax=Ancylobacter sp. IITR112 TaxID=3138073 RepID=UPI00352B28A3
MEIFYWKSPNGNVGDDLNPWLWPRLFGREFLEHAAGRRFFGIGSVLDERVFCQPHPNGATVFGAGMRGPMKAMPLRPDVDIRFVRGPLSSAALSAMGYGEIEHISDPAVLTPLYSTVAPESSACFNPPSPAQQPPPARRSSSLFIPYFDTPVNVIERVCRDTGLQPLPITSGVDRFIATLKTADKVVTEAMHGAILADAFRIPWAPCRISSGPTEGRTSQFKWDDWRRSLGLEPASIVSSLPYGVIERLPDRYRRQLKGLATVRASETVMRVLRDDRWHLSRDSILKTAQDRILEQAHRLARSPYPTSARRP